MNSHFTFKIRGLCVANLPNSLLLGAIRRLDVTHFKRKLFRPELIRGSLAACILFYPSLYAAKLKNNPDCQHVYLQVLGSGGPEINDNLASASFLVWINHKATIMFDAGGGSSLNFEKSSANFNDLKAVLFSHFHVDHSAAFPVYIKAGYFTGRNQNLPVFGPSSGGDFPSTEQFVSALFNDNQNSAYPYLSDNYRQQSSTEFLIQAKSISPDNHIWKKQLSHDLSIAAINVIHGPVPALAWRVNYKSCSISFSGDMNGSSGNLQKLAKNTDLLVANNAIPQEASFTARNLHMTPETIGEIAAEANVKKLLLAHFMLRTINNKPETVRLIQKNYKGEIILARDLMTVHLN